MIAAHPTAPWFEMRGVVALLTMRVSDLILRSPPQAGVSKDVATELENALTETMSAAESRGRHPFRVRRMATMTVSTDDAVPRGPLSARLTTTQIWGFVLLAPYVLVFLFFVLYPVGYGLWLARH